MPIILIGIKATGYTQWFERRRHYRCGYHRDHRVLPSLPHSGLLQTHWGRGCPNSVAEAPLTKMTTAPRAERGDGR